MTVQTAVHRQDSVENGERAFRTLETTQRHARLPARKLNRVERQVEEISYANADNETSDGAAFWTIGEGRKNSRTSNSPQIFGVLTAYTPKQMEDTIIKLLSQWSIKREHNKDERER